MRPRGVHGEIVADPLCDGGASRFEDLNSVTLLDPKGHLKGKYDLEEVWQHQARIVFKFAGVDSMNDAEPFRGCQVVIPRSERAPLDEGAFYYSDLIGCQMVDADSGSPIGKVTAFSENGGGAGFLEVDGHILVPYAKSILVDILPEQGLIRARLPEGLLDLY